MSKAKIIFTLLFCSFLTASVMAQTAPVPAAAVRTPEWTEYVPELDVNSIATAGNWELNIHKGKGELIKFLGPQASVSQNGDILFLTGSNASGAKYRADITLPDLDRVNVNGNSLVYINGFYQSFLSIKSSGTATILGLKNSINNLKLMIEGSSQVDFANSDLRSVSLEISGTNHTVLHMEGGGQITGTIEGQTVVNYIGNNVKQNVLVKGNATIAPLAKTK